MYNLSSFYELISSLTYHHKRHLISISCKIVTNYNVIDICSTIYVTQEYLCQQHSPYSPDTGLNPISQTSPLLTSVVAIHPLHIKSESSNSQVNDFFFFYVHVFSFAGGGVFFQPHKVVIKSLSHRPLKLKCLPFFLLFILLFSVYSFSIF